MTRTTFLSDVGKHNRSELEKGARNRLYAKRFRQLVCGECGHRTSKPGACAVCKARIRQSDFVRLVRE